MSGAGISYQLIAVSSEHVDAAAEVAYVYPVFALSYVNLAIDAYLDEIGANKWKTDTFSVGDTAFYSIAKQFADSYAVSDTLTQSVSKGLADSISTSEIVTVVKIFIRAFTETVSLSDSAALIFYKPVADVVVPEDVVSRAYSKTLTETLAFTEIIGKIVASALSDAASVADSAAKSQSKSLLDSTTISSSGVVVMQDYCDLTYFESDYVGVGRTFT